MKVAFIIYSLNRGGAERATVNLANHFCEQGWEASIVTIRDDIAPAYALIDGVQLIEMGLHTDSHSSLAGIVNNWKRVQAIRAIIKKNRVDVLIGMSSSANILVALACLVTPTLAVGSERSHPENKPISRSWSLFRQYGYCLLDTLICLTGETKEWLNTHTNAKNVVAIPNGVTVPLVSNEPIIPFSFHDDEKKYLISVGRLIPTKCVDHSIRVFTKLSKQHANWEFLILGDGPEKESLYALSDELNIKDKIHFLGGVGNLDDWYPKADLFLSCSIHEGFPNSLLEAMAYGVAPVSYDCPTGPKDLIEPERNGCLIPMADEEALYVALNDLMADDAKRRKYGVSAGSSRETFSMHSVGQRWSAEVLSLKG